MKPSTDDVEEQTTRRGTEPKPDIEADPEGGVGGADIKVDEQQGVGGPDIKPEETGS